MILAHSFPTAISSVPVTINQDMKALLPFRSEITDFILLVTKAMKPEVLELVKRSTHGTCKLLTKELFNLPIPIAPLLEQRRILTKVRELVSLCHELEAQLATAQDLRMGLSEAVLQRALGDAAELRLPEIDEAVSPA